MKIGNCSSTKLYKETVEAGYDYIEVPGVELAEFTEEEFEAVKAEILAGPIPCLAVNAYAKQYPKMVGDEVDDEKTREYAKLIVSRASQLGAKTVGIGAPNLRKVPEGYDKAKAWEQGKRFLKITADVAEEYGITILFESVHDWMCNFCCYVDEVNDMINDVNHPNLKMVYDYYHMKPMGTDIFDIEKYMKNIYHLHTSGIDENRKRPQLNDNDYDELVKIFKSVTACGYDRTFSNESDNTNLTTEGKYACELLRKAYAEACK